ncbi:MAG: hypothetical protein ACI9XP_001270 [Lentimonas sp.]|jgi:hypothetical protein
MTLRFKTLLYYSIFLFFSMTTISSCRKDSNIKIEKNHKKSTGSSSNDLLASKDYNSLIVELIIVSGQTPTQDALDNLKDMLEARLNKPNGITFVTTNIPSPQKSKYSLDDIIAIEDEHRTQFTDNNSIAASFIFIDGEYIENTSDSKVLGIAYYNTSMVIFEETIKSFSGGIGKPARFKLETVVINHEFGHILGLVNTGSAMQSQHQDVAHGAHCENEDCLMNWVAETGDAIENFLGTGPIPTFDNNCLNDLKSNGGK